MGKMVLFLLLATLLLGCGPGATPDNLAIPSPTTAVSQNALVTSGAPDVAPTTSPMQAEAAEAPATETPADPAASIGREGETAVLPSRTPEQPIEPQLQEYDVPPGSRPHDVAPAPDGTVLYTAQGSGELGRLDPQTGATTHIPLGPGSAPHGVIVGPDGAAWVTDGGLNAIVRVDLQTDAVEQFPLPTSTGYANLNTAAFDGDGILWFTGQSGFHGRLDPATGQLDVYNSPRGRGPYGIAAAPNGDIYYASLAGSYVGRINTGTGEVDVLEPPTPDQGARRVWSDSNGRIWVSEWNAGQLALFDPATGEWREWPLPGAQPRAYAVYVDEKDLVWLSDFGANSMVRFDPASETFESFPLPSPAGSVRQILGRSGEIWGAESAADKLIVIRTR